MKDTGVGIAEDDIKYIFDRFYRADRARKRESGTGLGLSISKWIAEAHKGAIEVESRPSLGQPFFHQTARERRKCMRNKKWYVVAVIIIVAAVISSLHEGEAGCPGGRCAAGGGSPGSKADHI